MTEVDLTEYLFHPAPVVSLPVRGTAALFPVRRIFCVGRNYADHAREMGHDPDREQPFFFTKPPEAVVAPGDPLPYPPATRDLHHEVELVVALAQGGRDLSADDALELVFGYAVGVDLTRRDLQAEAKKLGRPWDSAKAFAGSAPCSEIVPVERIGHPTRGRIALSVDEEVRQDGDLAQMIWKTPEILAELSKLWTLAPGDLIFTGTPAGVGPISAGDRLDCEIEGVGSYTARVAG
ncbi:fumarylacetoacetate hydrolase family protein [Algihabitans sp.]|uniref:fumarylacetoacetate hydrolase family protein n=1 Tax=Algihabitans sp. TaxID=2821514 RepID=UPI003BAB48CC